jgi:hypothetical protein
MLATIHDATSMPLMKIPGRLPLADITNRPK